MRPSDDESGEDNEMLVAYVWGDTPPDFAAIVACGFEIVGLDTLAPWFGTEVVEDAKANGLLVAAWPMSYVPGVSLAAQHGHRIGRGGTAGRQTAGQQSDGNEGQ